MICISADLNLKFIQHNLNILPILPSSGLPSTQVNCYTANYGYFYMPTYILTMEGSKRQWTRPTKSKYQLVSIYKTIQLSKIMNFHSINYLLNLTSLFLFLLQTTDFCIYLLVKLNGWRTKNDLLLNIPRS